MAGRFFLAASGVCKANEQCSPFFQCLAGGSSLAKQREVKGEQKKV